MGVLANAGKNIQHLASVLLRVLHAVRGEKRQSICARKIDQFTIDAFLAANEMSLNFDENVFAAKRVDQKSGAVSKTLGSARASRANASPARTERVPAIANFLFGFSTFAADAIQRIDCFGATREVVDSLYGGFSTANN